MKKTWTPWEKCGLAMKLVNAKVHKLQIECEPTSVDHVF